MNALSPNKALASVLASWDGKTTSDLKAAAARFSNQPAYLTDLVPLAADPALQRGATWLILDSLKGGATFTAHQEARLLDTLPLLDDWQARLHLLQCLHYLEFPERRCTEVEGFVRKCLTASNKFERAWAYSGFHELAVRFPRYGKEAAQIFALALKDEAPSVKARIRQLKLRD